MISTWISVQPKFLNVQLYPSIRNLNLQISDIYVIYLYLVSLWLITVWNKKENRLLLEYAWLYATLTTLLSLKPHWLIKQPYLEQDQSNPHQKPTSNRQHAVMKNGSWVSSWDQGAPKWMYLVVSSSTGTKDVCTSVLLYLWYTNPWDSARNM